LIEGVKVQTGMSGLDELMEFFRGGLIIISGRLGAGNSFRATFIYRRPI